MDLLAWIFSAVAAFIISGVWLWLGIREHRRWPVLVGVACLIIGVGLVWLGIAQDNTDSPYRKPVSNEPLPTLQPETEPVNTAVELPLPSTPPAPPPLPSTPEEIHQHLLADQLTPAQVHVAIEKALAIQADHSLTWQPIWGDLIETARSKGQVTDAQWQRYAKQAVEGIFSLKLRPRIRRGDPIPMQIKRSAGRVGKTKPVLWFQRTGKQMDFGTFTRRYRHGAGASLSSPSHYAGASSSIKLKPDEWDQLDPGPHTTILQLEVTVLQDSLTGPAIISLPVELHADWEMTNANTPIVQPIDDDSYQAAVQQSITIKILKDRSYLNQALIIIRAKSLPVSLACDVLLRRDDREWLIGSCSLKDGPPSSRAVSRLMEDFTFDTADVVLRPNAEEAVKTVDLTEYYNHELVFKDVPINRVVR